MKPVLFILAALLAGPAARADLDLTAARPPQYVVLAFDGSKSLNMWSDSRRFAREESSAGRPLKFTYFVNAVYYLADGYKKAYLAPEKGAGKSAIGFGGTPKEVLARFDQTNLAHEEGHEIANHAAGHFDGSRWSEAEWKDEFTQFYDLFFNLFRTNHVAPTQRFHSGWAFDQRDMIGFRAPQLGKNKGMYDALPQFGIRYDTSNTGLPAAWPKKQNGLWMFPLASIPVAGTGRKVLAMDYNFYYLQSGAKPNPARAEDFEEQMYQSYIHYFETNYRGNRAPINIGHHFAPWNKGAYWRALQRFAKAVCGQPETKCVTYRELVAELEKSSPAQLAAYESAPPSLTASVDLGLSQSFRPFTVPEEPAGFDPARLEAVDPPEAHEE